MPEFIVPMRIVREGVDAFVTAENAAEARSKADGGEWHHLEDDRAETVDWSSTGPATENA